MHLSLKEKENTLYMTLVKLAFFVLSLVMADNRIRQKMRSIVVEEKRKKTARKRGHIIDMSCSIEKMLLCHLRF